MLWGSGNPVSHGRWNWPSAQEIMQPPDKATNHHRSYHGSLLGSRPSELYDY